MTATADPTNSDKAKSHSGTCEVNFWQNFRSLFAGFGNDVDIEDDGTEAVIFNGRF